MAGHPPPARPRWRGAPATWRSARVTAFSRRAAAELLPFPELRFGWGLDSHWGALARERGWRLGVVDALPVRHETQVVASTYTHAEAIAEAGEFLAGRPYVTRAPRRSGRWPPSGGCPGEPSVKLLVVPKWYPWPGAPGVRHLLPRARPRPGHAPRGRGARLAGHPQARLRCSTELTDEVEDGIRTLRVRYRRRWLRPLAMVCQLLGMLAARRRLRRDGFRPDVVHAHVYSAGLPALLLARSARAAVAVTEHYTGFQRGLVTGVDRLMARVAFRARRRWWRR